MTNAGAFSQGAKDESWDSKILDVSTRFFVTVLTHVRTFHLVANYSSVLEVAVTNNERGERYL